MLRTQFFALIAGLVLLAVSVVAGNQIFGEPVESAPTIPVDQQVTPDTDAELILALA